MKRGRAWACLLITHSSAGVKWLFFSCYVVKTSTLVIKQIFSGKFDCTLRKIHVCI